MVGRTLNLDSKPRTVIGIMPQDFQFLNNAADLILPQQIDRNKVYLGNFSYQGIARLKPGDHDAAGQRRPRAHAGDLAESVAHAARLRAALCLRMRASVPISGR